MALRVAHIGKVSEDFARRLQAAPAVGRVLHPALPSSPGHRFRARDMRASSWVFSLLLVADTEARLDGALVKVSILRT